MVAYTKPSRQGEQSGRPSAPSVVDAGQAMLSKDCGVGAINASPTEDATGRGPGPGLDLDWTWTWARVPRGYVAREFWVMAWPLVRRCYAKANLI
jgi:hypothetical protein